MSSGIVLFPAGWKGSAVCEKDPFNDTGTNVVGVQLVVGKVRPLQFVKHRRREFPQPLDAKCGSLGVLEAARGANLGDEAVRHGRAESRVLREPDGDRRGHPLGVTPHQGGSLELRGEAVRVLPEANHEERDASSSRPPDLLLSPVGG